MLKIYYNCSNCGSSDEAEEWMLDGCCPNCHAHHGDVTYEYEGDVGDFLLALSKMSNSEIANYAPVIRFIAKDVLYEI